MTSDLYPVTITSWNDLIDFVERLDRREASRAKVEVADVEPGRAEPGPWLTDIFGRDLSDLCIGRIGARTQVGLRPDLAHLIDAAPELLACLEATREAVEDAAIGAWLTPGSPEDLEVREHYRAMLVRVDAAIAKARGAAPAEAAGDD